MRENCGVFGVYSKEDCVPYLFKGTFNLQHRGEKYWGLVTSNGKKIKKPLTYEGKIDTSEKGLGAKLRRLSANYGIGHTSLKEKQPVVRYSKIGEFATCFSGKLINKKHLLNKLVQRNHTFSLKPTDVGVLAELISEGNNIVDSIKRMKEEVRGAYSLLVLNKEGIYAFRDSYGFKPLILGENESTYAIASESCALKEIGIKSENYRDVEAGEIVFIGKNGIETIERLESIREAICSFEYGYHERPDSITRGIPINAARDRAGAALARIDKANGLEVDLVMAIRDSGARYAIGYAREAGIPLDEGLFKNWYITRTFIQPIQALREFGVALKQSVIEDVVKGKRIKLIDDSIVRATTIKKLVRLLKDFGAKEVDVGIGCSMIIDYCRYGISTKKKKEPIAATKSKEEIRSFIGADSLEFNSLDDFVDAIVNCEGSKITRSDLCLTCFDGKPIL